MPSPFPGMNPYLEKPSAWKDFHNRLIVALADALASQVDPNYVVKIEEHLYIHNPSEETHEPLGQSDVSLRPDRAGPAPAATAVLEAPVKVQLPRIKTERITRVEILDRDDEQVITVLEILSPSNKYAGEDREQYFHKRSEYLSSWVHFVEIDLLRGGPRLPVEAMPACDYYILVSRIPDRPSADLWPFRLRDRIPNFPMPLRNPDEQVVVDLQGLLHQVYDAARYATWLYNRPPTPALSAEDALWANQFLPPRPA